MQNYNSTIYNCNDNCNTIIRLQLCFVKLRMYVCPHVKFSVMYVCHAFKCVVFFHNSSMYVRTYIYATWTSLYVLHTSILFVHKLFDLCR